MTLTPMTLTTTRGPLSAMAAISLAELLDSAALQTRVDRKYLVAVDELPALLAALPPDTRALEIDGSRSFGYESVYFDTDDLVCYRLTAHRRRRRFKVRTRTYLDSAECWLEVKTAGSRGRTVKNRLAYDLADRDTIAPGRSFVDSVFDQESILFADAPQFHATLITRYRRSTLLLPSTASRVTIDTDLVWEHAGRRLRVPDLAVVETKTGATASRVDRLLWARRCRPARISKYATGLAALRPDLPAARWRHTLRRHLTGSSEPDRPGSTGLVRAGSRQD